MGFLDRLVGKATRPAAPRPLNPAPTPTPESAEETAVPPPPSGNLVPQLTAAREKLEQRDLDGARAIYEEVLVAAGDRPDVLVTISGDLGSCGYLVPIVELIAPRYDAERHGPATGLNLLQAYLALRNPEAAQHVLDILFALKRPDLEERLWGFSNAIAELIEARKKDPATAGAPARQIQLITISRPIWSYGLEGLSEVLPVKAGGQRRVAFAQLSTLGLPETEQRMARPEDALARLSRGLPLWLAETLYFSAQYEPVGVVGVMGQAHYAIFPTEWTTDNIRQLIDSGGQFDYVMTGALQEHSGDFALVLRLWEIKSFRERKTFEARWTPATANEVLGRLHTQLRTFFEWKATSGLAYAPPTAPLPWVETLAVSLSHFLADKGVLPKEQVVLVPGTLAAPADQEMASLAHLTLAARARRLGLTEPGETPLWASAVVEQAQELLAGPPPAV